MYNYSIYTSGKDKVRLVLILGKMFCGEEDDMGETASDYVHLDVEEIVKETEKAFLLLLSNGSKHWVPMSVCADSDNYSEGDRNCTVSVRRWFAEKEGLSDG